MVHSIVVFFLASMLCHMPQKIHQLPITSEPLANNPEHLTWDAYPAINVPPYRPYSMGETETRVKVPKSIFITPNFNESKCSEGYRYDALTHKCHKVQIQVNQQELVIQQALQLFQLQQEQQLQQQQQQTEGVEYDYDDEYNTDDAPYHIPLTLSFSISEPFSGTTAALTTSSSSSSASTTPFRDNGVASDAEPNSAATSTSPAAATTQGHAQYYPHRYGTTVVASGSSGHVQATGQKTVATRAPATTLADGVDMVGFPTTLDDDALTTFAISATLPQRQMTTRSAVSATTEMMPTDTTKSSSSDTINTLATEGSTTPIITSPTTTSTTTTAAPANEVETTTTLITTTVLTSDTSDVKITTAIPFATDVLENTIPTTTNDHESTVDIFADRNAAKHTDDDSVIVESSSKEAIETTEEGILNDRLLKQDELIADKIATQPTTTVTDQDDEDNIATTTTTTATKVALSNVAEATDAPVLPTLSADSSGGSEEMQLLNDTLPTTIPATIVTPSAEITTSQTNVGQSNVFVVTPERAETTPMVPPTTTLADTTTATATTDVTSINTEEITAPLTTTPMQNLPTTTKSAIMTEMPTTSTQTTDESTVTYEADSTPVTATTIAAVSPTKLPAHAPQRNNSSNLIEQLRLINLFSRDQHRVRFPGTGARYQHERPSIFVNRRTNGASTDFRFPSPTSAHHGHGKIVDRAPFFSWLPPNWRSASVGGTNASHHGPTNTSSRKALNFWNGMPLIRDPALFSVGGGGVGVGVGSVPASTDRSMRANSKSPTEHLFRQETQQLHHQWHHRDAAAVAVDAVVEPTEVAGGSDGDGINQNNEDVFRVLTTKNAHYHNR